MSADLGDLTLGADQPATGRMLIAQRRCKAICLVAVEGEAASCACECGGRYHGKLADALDQPVEDSARRTTARLPGEHPDQIAAFDVALPEPAGAVA